MYRRLKFGVIALLAGLLALATGVRAQTVVQTPQVRAEMTTERAAIGPGESVWVALSLDIKPGWHTYWRTPGDSGLPTTIRWSLPEGASAGDLQYPAPERIRYGDLMNFGYHNRVTLLTDLKFGDAAGDVVVKADATWLVCADVCIPEDGHFEFPLKISPGVPQRNSAAGAAIAAAREQLPKPAPWPVKVSREGKDIVLALGPGLDRSAAKAVTFFPYQEGLIVNVADQKARWDGDTLTLKILADTGSEKIGEAAGVVTLAAEGGATTGYTLAAPIIWSAPSGGDLSLAVALLFALVGGLILNVMPCVLPVLMMKALSFAKHADQDANTRRRDGLAYTAGVMAAFTALVAALLALRSAGAAVGWGFQLQSPVFVAVLVYVLLAVGLSLSGVFTIGALDVGDSLARKRGASGAFFTGLLAVVVAAPCTAPFMAGAIGFALTQSTATTVLVFEALALGLALPYLALSFSPAAVRLLPKPGAWMERFKQVLAFGLYGVAAWLLWVLTQQVDATGLAAGFAAGVFVAFAAWLWGVAQRSAGRERIWAMGLTGIALLAAVFLTATLANRPAMAAKTTSEAGASSEPYSEAKLVALRAEGRPVFVNFTAAWCLTCIVNETAALSTAEVESAFKAANVAYLKADWTNRDAEISGALRALGRDGVPLYVFYGPGNAPPKILPQILTPAIIRESISGA